MRPVPVVLRPIAFWPHWSAAETRHSMHRMQRESWSPLSDPCMPCMVLRLLNVHAARCTLFGARCDIAPPTCALLGRRVPAGGAGALLDVIALAPAPPADGVRLVAALTYEQRADRCTRCCHACSGSAFSCTQPRTPPFSHQSFPFPCPSCPWCQAGERNGEGRKGRDRKHTWEDCADGATPFTPTSCKSVW